MLIFNLQSAVFLELGDAIATLRIPDVTLFGGDAELVRSECLAFQADDNSAVYKKMDITAGFGTATDSHLRRIVYVPTQQAQYGFDDVVYNADLIGKQVSALFPDVYCFDVHAHVFLPNSVIEPTSRVRI